MGQNNKNIEVNKKGNKKSNKNQFSKNGEKKGTQLKQEEEN